MTGKLGSEQQGMQKLFLLNRRRDQGQCTSVAEWAVTSVFEQYCGVF